MDPNDIWGDLFDFNGDGKTDLTEEMMAYHIMRECQNEDKETTYSRPHKPKESVSFNNLPRMKTIPEIVDDSNVKHLRSDARIEIISAIVTLFLIMLPVCAIIYAAIMSYDEKNSASWLVVMLFVGGGCLVGGITIYQVAKSIQQAIENLKQIKERYKSNSQK